MFLLFLERRLIWSRPNGDGGTSFYYYDDDRVWIAAALALALVWLTWFVVTRYSRRRAFQRRPRRTDHRTLKRVVKRKRELSARYLRPGFSANIHGVGVGVLAGSDRYCIQVFINNVNDELWAGAGAGAALPASYRGVPVVTLEMSPASLLAEAGLSAPSAWAQYSNGIRERQEVIVGGISGAHTNLTGESGTIGYFCTRKSRLPRRREIHLLSNSHVFADLRKARADEGDLIMQPSPGEPDSNRPIGTLSNYSALKFDGETSEPNHIDAAIARLWGPHQHKPVIPLIGAVKGYVAKKDIELGEAARKFGRTTGYTEGRIFSIYLDLWVRYDRTGQSAFFQNQFLIEPSLPNFERFVAKGDSGSLVVDTGQHAIGLIFAGMSEVPEQTRAVPDTEPAGGSVSTDERPRRIESYGVANPISEVLDRLKIELLV